MRNDRFLRSSMTDQLTSTPARTVGAAVLFALLTVPGGARAQQQQPDTTALPEVLVSAEKRSENLQEVPVPVSVLNADSLADSGNVLIKDYFSSTPGLSFSPSILGSSNLAIRGITTSGFTNPTVGVLIDDSPFTSSTNNFNAGEVPDLDPGDLDHIEVLRGPQGTLYGANAMGGLIKYVTKDPSTDALSGRIEAGTSDVYNGAQPGFTLRGSANIPLGDTLAMRASAFTRQDPGYIDDPISSTKGVNEAFAYGGRLAALWRPSTDFSLKLSALYQRTKALGNAEENVVPGLGQLQQNYLKDTGGYDRLVQTYAATLNYKYHDIDLTSVTGYNVTRTQNSVDTTDVFGDCCTQPIFGVTGTKYVNQFNLDKLTQELRATIPMGPFELLIGGFYTRETLPGTHTFVYAVDDVSYNVAGVLLHTSDAHDTSSFEEHAVFADLTYRLNDQFDIQFGGRESWDQETDNPLLATGPFVPILYGGASPPFTTPQLKADSSTFTYLVTPRFRITPDLMVYARAASGYRPGGPNTVDLVAEGAPPSFSPDKTRNYELGVKADLLDHRVSIDTSLYYIDWKNIQLQLLDTFSNAYGANGGAAKSDGVEFSVAARPVQGLSVSAWVDYINAVLTEDLPANSSVQGQSGDRLPLSSRFSGNIALDEDVPLYKDLSAFFGGQVSYVGDRLGQFQSGNPRQVFPSYTKTDVHLGIKNGSWRISLFVNNAANVRGLLNGGPADLYNPTAFLYIPPRTIGLTAIQTF